MKKETPKSYQEALEELQGIKASLESGDIGIDGIQVAISRAGFLLDFCKSKLRNVQESIEKMSEES